MKYRHISLFMLTLPATLLFLGTPTHAAFKGTGKIICWENNEGIRECGNAVPPEYAQKEARTINERGMTTDIKERAKTPEEIAAEKALLAEETRIQEEEEQRRKAQLNYDLGLLSTYLSEEDIIRSRDRQSAVIDGTIKVTNDAISKLETKLETEKKSAAGYERQGKPLPERVQEDIASLQEQIDAKSRFVESKQTEKQKLHEKYDADMSRFRELKQTGITLDSIQRQESK